jgi:hypothetical protein
VSGRRGRRPRQLMDDLKNKDIERGNIRLHSVENLLSNRLWTCHKQTTEYTNITKGTNISLVVLVS